MSQIIGTKKENNEIKHKIKPKKKKKRKNRYLKEAPQR
jgi:hypothetical protein